MDRPHLRMEPYLENLPPELFLQVLEKLPHPTQVCGLSSNLYNRRDFAMEVRARREERGQKLREAFKNKAYKEAQRLLEERVDLKTLTELLHQEAYNNNTEALDLLAPYIGLPSFEKMVQSGSPFLIHYLLEKGVDPNPGLPLAIKRGWPNIISDILDHGAIVTGYDILLELENIENRRHMNIPIAAKRDTTILRILFDHIRDGINFEPALRFAASRNNTRLVEILLDYGVIPTMEAFSEALRHNLISAKILIDHGISPNAEGGLPLFIASHYSPLAVKFLLKEGANPSNPAVFNFLVNSNEKEYPYSRQILEELLNAGGVPPANLVPALKRILNLSKCDYNSKCG